MSEMGDRRVLWSGGVVMVVDVGDLAALDGDGCSSVVHDD